VSGVARTVHTRDELLESNEIDSMYDSMSVLSLCFFSVSFAARFVSFSVGVLALRGEDELTFVNERRRGISSRPSYVLSTGISSGL
jgi:hypothetical protein